MKLTDESSHIKIDGHRGTWYVVESRAYQKGERWERLYELEHETYGDEAAHLIVTQSGEVVLDDVWNGFLDAEEDGWELQPLEENGWGCEENYCAYEHYDPEDGSTTREEGAPEHCFDCPFWVKGGKGLAQ